MNKFHEIIYFIYFEKLELFNLKDVKKIYQTIEKMTFLLLLLNVN
jgi:hypothetical protein